MPGPAPWHLYGQYIGGIEREQIEFPPVLPSHCGKASEEETLLCESLRNPAAAVHPRDRMQHSLPPVRQDPFGFFPFHAIPAGPGSARSHNEAHLAGFQRTRDQVLQDSDELVLRHLSVDVNAKTPVKILLSGEHLSQAALVLFDRLALVGEDDFRIDHDGKVYDHEFTEDARERGIGQVLQTDPGIEQASDFQVVVLFILDVYVGYLASGALIPE